MLAVKAFITLVNNALPCYSNKKLIGDAMMSQELVVPHEHLIFPTAQLSG